MNRMQANSPIWIKVVSVFFIIYGILDIGEFFMPVETDATIEYSLPFLGIVLLLPGIGMLLLKEWARKVAAFGCVYAVIISILGLRLASTFELFIGFIFICLFGLIFMYLTRSSIQSYFIKKS